MTQIENESVIVDVGLENRGACAFARIWRRLGNRGEVNIGDEVEVYIERIENMLGEAVLSCDKARREGAWRGLGASAHAESRPVEGASSPAA